MKREEFEAAIAKTKHGSPEEQAVYDQLLADARRYGIADGTDAVIRFKGVWYVVWSRGGRFYSSTGSLICCHGEQDRYASTKSLAALLKPATKGVKHGKKK